MDAEEWLANMGNAIRADDLIPEESEQVQLALKRLSPKEAYDRVFRMRRAFQVYSITRRESQREVHGLMRIQCSLTHQLLPKNEWTKAENVRLSFPVKKSRGRLRDSRSS